MQIEQKQKNVDWLLLMFLLLFTNQAVFSVKILGLIFIYLFRFNFKFNFKAKQSPRFYIYIILLALVNYAVFIRDYSIGYTSAFIVGNLFWLFSLMAFHQVRLSLDRYGLNCFNNTLKAFTIINTLAALYQLGTIMLITGRLNPYTGLDFPYGMSTGDNIFGAFLQNSYYNLTVSGFLTVYFLYKRQFFYTLLASTTLILVFGNFGTLVYLAMLFGMMVVGIINEILGRKYQLFNKFSPPSGSIWQIPVLLVYVVVFYSLLSPSNTKYIVDKFKNKIYSLSTSGTNNYRTQIANQKVDPRAYDPYVSNYYELREKENKKNERLYLSDYSTQSKGKQQEAAYELKREMTESYILQLQGKTLSVIETYQYLKSSPRNLLFGAGTARFSSLTAQKVAGYDSSRLFMQVLPHYQAEEYKNNHMILIDERIKSDPEFFSTFNWPDSFYNQIFGEYGLLGFAIFVLFYVGFFVRKFKYWSYTFWLFVILIPFMHLNYIFDTLCIMPFFEWMVLADIKRGKLNTAATHE